MEFAPLAALMGEFARKESPRWPIAEGKLVEIIRAGRVCETRDVFLRMQRAGRQEQLDFLFCAALHLFMFEKGSLSREAGKLAQELMPAVSLEGIQKYALGGRSYLSMLKLLDMSAGSKDEINCRVERTASLLAAIYSRVEKNGVGPRGKDRPAEAMAENVDNMRHAGENAARAATLFMERIRRRSIEIGEGVSLEIPAPLAV
jgi:hypothetical protein